MTEFPAKLTPNDLPDDLLKVLSRNFMDTVGVAVTHDSIDPFDGTTTKFHLFAVKDEDE